MNKRRLANLLQRFYFLRWILKLGVRGVIPRHYVGSVGVIFNQAGQVLMVEHVFRAEYSWGLPGGWVERNEDPAETVRRELAEELNLEVEIKRILLCDLQGYEAGRIAPRGLGLAYYCRVAENQPSVPEHLAYEILSTRWINPAQIPWQLTTLESKAIALGQEEFKREQGL